MIPTRKPKRNQKIRDYAKNSGIKMYELAEGVGVDASYLSVLLRKSLTEEQEQEFMDTIDQLAAKQEA